jgi:ADP-heptose:LPS heptosyltransferase
MAGLQIYAPRERRLVAAADAVISPLGWFRRRPAASATVTRVLLLRLERIGDLLMTLDAIAAARSAWPGATIDLAVGSWNRDLARLIPGIGTVITIDVPWLAREGTGDRWSTLVSRAREWRGRYDVVANFEPDIRSNFLVWLTGARRRAGYWTGGGGSFLTDGLEFDPSAHVSENSLRLIRAVAGSSASAATPHSAQPVRLEVPADARARAAALLGGAGRPIVGVHVSGGRESKQWHLDRFAEVAKRLARERSATIVLTGSAADRPMVDLVRAQLTGHPVIDVAGSLDLVTLAGLLAQLDLLVTGDTGPMHLASAVGTPIVALFGPADPRRYGPRSPLQRILRVDLPCSPCGQVRLPPERCRGHVPDCMDGIQVDVVLAAVRELLDNRTGVAQTGA